MSKLIRLAARVRVSLIVVLAFGVIALTSASSVDNHLIDTMRERFGSDGETLLTALINLLDEADQLPERDQLERVNDFFNQHVRFTDDLTLWQRNDYWATPLETLGVRAGDCEDYTIAKYMSLLRLGVPRERLRLIYVRAQIGGTYSQVSQAHMVLGYYESPTAMPLILDNLVARIQPATERPDLKPVFSFNSEGLWIGGNTESQADPTARLSRWRDLLMRAQQEGFYE
jgi:predicted transglutaminase-like cysteine proteinase